MAGYTAYLDWKIGMAVGGSGGRLTRSPGNSARSDSDSDHETTDSDTDSDSDTGAATAARARARAAVTVSATATAIAPLTAPSVATPRCA